MLRDAPDAALLSGSTLLNDGRGADVETGAELGAAFSLRVQIEF